MVGRNEKGELARIEDFIILAREARDVKVAVDLKKQLVTQKVHPGHNEDMKSEIDMYLLIAHYTFRSGKEVNQVSKVYMFASSEESPDALKVNTTIANARLEMDYQRLRDAKITFEKKYF
jgi:hypothetical protein